MNIIKLQKEIKNLSDADLLRIKYVVIGEISERGL